MKKVLRIGQYGHLSIKTEYLYSDYRVRHCNINAYNFFAVLNDFHK